MTIEKLPSGSYRIKQMYNGKTYRVTVDHKPTQKEALILLAEAMDGCDIKGSFKTAALDYIDMKRNILSPRTIREYSFYPERLPEWFNKLSVSRIAAEDVQRCVNDLARTMSPKTVRCLHGFISAVLRTVKPNLVLRTTLPRIDTKEPYLPTSEDLIKILEEAQGTQYTIPIMLACHGLRRGEICALELSDLDDNDILHITKDLVQAPDGSWVKKPPKTSSSIRSIPIEPELAAMIREQGYIFKGFPGTISNFLTRTQDKLGMEHFSLHKLRHLFASLMLYWGYDMKTAQGFGGWHGDETLRKVYWQSLDMRDETVKREIAARIGEFYRRG